MANTADFEAGSNGSAILAADPGSATAWGAIDSAGTGGSITYDNAHAYGNLAMKLVRPTTGAKAARWNYSLSDEYWRAYLYHTANPTSKDYFMECRGDSNQLATRIGLRTDGKLAVDNNLGTEINVSGLAIPLNQWIRVEWHIIHSTTAGQVLVQIFNNADTATLSDSITTATNINTRALGERTGIGAPVSGQDGFTRWVDNVVGIDTNWPGPAGGVVSRAPNLLLLGVG